MKEEYKSVLKTLEQERADLTAKLANVEKAVLSVLAVADPVNTLPDTLAVPHAPKLPKYVALTLKRYALKQKQSKLSAEGRKNIIAAQRKRWAAIRKAASARGTVVGKAKASANGKGLKLAS